MNTKWILILIVAAALLFPAVARADDARDDKYVFGGTYTLDAGQTLDGNLYVFGGLATLEVDSRVDGDVILAGGTLRVAGEVDGDITATAGLVNLEGTAVVDGNVVITAANLEQDEGAEVRGEVTQHGNVPFQFGSPPDPRRPSVPVHANPFWDVSWLFFRSFLWAGLAILAVLFMPRHTERAANAAMAQPLIAAGLGLVTAVVVPLLLVITAITIIGIPVTLVGALALLLAWAFGVIALGTEIGRRVAVLLKQEWALAVSAGVGAFILTLLMNLLGRIWCVGWMIPALVGAIGLGAVLLTRFGTRAYLTSVPPAPPVPPPPLVPPLNREDDLPGPQF